VEKVITELGVGEGLVSFLDDKGTPGMVERALVCPPHSQIGAITPQQRQQLIQNSVVAGVYEKAVDRESAYEKLKGRASSAPAASPRAQSQPAPAQAPSGPASSSPSWYDTISTTVGNLGLGGSTGPRGGRRNDTVVDAMVKSAARSIGSSVGRQLIRGVLGSLLSGR
jgi:DNA helicase HerA-like ATPase